MRHCYGTNWSKAKRINHKYHAGRARQKCYKRIPGINSRLIWTENRSDHKLQINPSYSQFFTFFFSFFLIISVQLRACIDNDRTQFSDDFVHSRIFTKEDLLTNCVHTHFLITAHPSRIPQMHVPRQITHLEDHPRTGSQHCVCLRVSSRDC